MFNLKNNFFILLLIALFCFLPCTQVLAADKYTPTELQFEVDTGKIASGTQLGTQNPVYVASYVINAFLGILGLVFLILTIYGGFIWMKARGNEEEVTKAKHTIEAAVIGILIVLASYGISTYIFQVVYNISATT